MKTVYYPGCTLKTKAQNLEAGAMAALDTLGVEVTELDRWNCCGAVYSLSDDDLLHQVAPVRNLVRAQEAGGDTLVTLCSQCYNTLERANRLMENDEEKRDTINRFMDEEPDYNGGVRVLHYLTFLRDHVGFDKVRAAVKTPLTGLKVAPFYGCSLLRPDDAAIDGAKPTVLQDLMEALGAEVLDFAQSTSCCGSYQGVAHPEAAAKRTGEVLESAATEGIEALALSCPLCEYNLGTRQDAALATTGGAARISTFYFTQLLAVALGLDANFYRFDLSDERSGKLMAEKKYITAAV